MTTTAPAPPPTASRLRWWREFLYIAVFYLVYSGIRNQFGSASVSSDHAFHNARRVIALERHLSLFVEAAVQRRFLGWHSFVQFWNLYYGTFHFVVTAFCIIWL